MSPDGERLLDDLAAVEAPLRSKMRRYFHDSCPGAFSLEREYVNECGPTRVRDSVSEMVVLEHVLDPEVLDGDEGVAVNVTPSRLVRVVLALAGDLEVLFRGPLGRLTAPVRSFLPAGRLALRNPKFPLGLLEAARVLDRLAFGVGKEHLEANVDPNSGTVPLLRYRRR